MLLDAGVSEMKKTPEGKTVVKPVFKPSRSKSGSDRNGKYDPLGN